MTSHRIGVGLLGAGTAAQAVHLPTLARLGDLFEVCHVSDVDAGLARRVAASVDCSWSSEEADILSDSTVEVVVVCTPDQHHARQVIAACRANKRAVLCEKPLALTDQEADDVLAVSESTGVPVVAGTMLSFDPAVRDARLHWADLPETLALVRSTIYLPSNELITGAATQLASTPMRPPLTPLSPSAEVQSEILHRMLVGLAGHNMPLLRELMPADVVVVAARLLKPLGYLVSLISDRMTAQLLSVWPGQWPSAWTVEACAPEQHLTICFPPSFVMGGSAQATLETRSGSRFWRYDENGYQKEWRHVAALLDGKTDPYATIGRAVLDAKFALNIASQAAAHLKSTVR